MAHRGVRGLFYTLAQLLGDVEAIHQGPKAIVRRLGAPGRGDGHGMVDAGVDKIALGIMWGLKEKGLSRLT